MYKLLFTDPDLNYSDYLMTMLVTTVYYCDNYTVNDVSGYCGTVFGDDVGNEVLLENTTREEHNALVRHMYENGYCDITDKTVVYNNEVEQ